jgi:hypothetical protein
MAPSTPATTPDDADQQVEDAVFAGGEAEAAGEQELQRAPVIADPVA